MLVSDQKASLRAKLLGMRNDLGPEDVTIRSRRIHDHILAIPLVQQAQTILTYVEKPGEVQTLPLVRTWLDEGKQVLAPGFEKAGFAGANSITTTAPYMDWIRVYDVDTLVPGRFGLLQPPGIPIKNPPSDAPVICPGIVFSEECHRIGYGGGYFDRFLTTQKSARIGLAFDFQVIENVPVEAHDIPMDIVVCESRFLVPPKGLVPNTLTSRTFIRHQ